MAKRCGECQNWVPNSSSSASGEGVCGTFIEDKALRDKVFKLKVINEMEKLFLEDGVAIMVSAYDERAGKCPGFKEAERMRTDSDEFSYDPSLRSMRGFDEK